MEYTLIVTTAVFLAGEVVGSFTMSWDPSPTLADCLKTAAEVETQLANVLTMTCTKADAPTQGET